MKIGKPGKAQERVPCKDISEGILKMPGKPRAYSVEPMETEVRGKPQQLVEVKDIDECDTDKEFACAEYAKEANEYLKMREVWDFIFLVSKYLWAEIQLKLAHKRHF